MKGTVSVNPLFEDLGINNPTVHNVEPLIASDNHRLYFRSQAICKKWEYKSVISTCYSKKYSTVLVLSEDGRIHVFTEELEEIAKIPWDAKYSVCLELIDELDMFLMIGATEVEIQYVKIHSNLKSTKFISSMSFNIERKDKYICEPDTKLQWNKGYNYDLKANLLYIWSSKDINFYSLDKLKLHSHIASLTRKEISITYVLYNSYYRYTVTGLANGHIKAWRLNEMKNNTAKDYILIHNFIRHAKGVDKVVQGWDHRVIISSSSEMIVCFWSLETFEQLREYNFLGEYSRILLHNSLYSLAIKDSSLGELKFGKNLEFISDIANEIMYMDKYRGITEDLSVPQATQSLQITLSSNMGFRITEEQLNKKDLNKIDIQYIYPPLKAKGIHQIISSPYAANQYYLLVENGEVFKLRIEDNSGRIEESYQIERAKDIELHQLNQSPTIIKFLPFVPPHFDSEINDNSLEKKEHKVDGNEEMSQLQMREFLQLKLITIGCSKGTVIFLRTYNFEQIYTRVTYHREAIIGLEHFRTKKHKYLATLCAENYLKLVKFDEEKAYCTLSIFTAETIKIVRGFEDKLALIMKKGIFQIFNLSDDNDKEICYPNTKTQDHEQEILSFDINFKNKLIVTAAADNCIKIWTYYKVLVYQVLLDDGLKHAVWFRDFELLIEHNFKILYLRNLGLRIRPEEIEEENQIVIESAEETLGIADVIKKVNELREEPKFQIMHINHSRVADSPKKSPKVSKHFNQFQKKESIISEIQMPKREERKKGVVHKNSKVENKKKIQQRSLIMEEQAKSQSHHHIMESDLQAMKRHMEDIKQLRKKTNESILPKIKPKSEDAFDNFMKAKLLNKKILTRRDITLNRIIMKNIIREHFGNDSDITNNLKLDF